MPIYEYECEKCGSFEFSQGINERPLTRCPSCRRKVQRLISATSFQLKGSGWYSDGYQGKTPKTGGAGGETKKSSEKKPESSTTEKVADKPADKKPSASPKGEGSAS